MELSQLCTILGAAQSSNPQQRKAAEQTLLQVVFLATPLPHSAAVVCTRASWQTGHV